MGNDVRKLFASSKLISSRLADFWRGFWVQIKSDWVDARRDRDICPSFSSKLMASVRRGGNGSHILTRAGTTGVKNLCLFSLSKTVNNVLATLKHSLAIQRDLTIGYCFTK